MESTPKRQIMVVGSHWSYDRDVAAIGVAFKGGRVVCADVVSAASESAAEILAVIRAAEIASKANRFETRILTASSLVVAIANGELEYGDPAALLISDHEEIAVEQRPYGFVRSAHILARQTFKAWEAGQLGGFTWTAGPLLTGESSLIA